MINNKTIAVECIIPESAKIEPGVSIGSRVILDGENITVGLNARLDSGCIIGNGVTIGQGAWVRAGAVVLRSIPANSIVEGNPARVVGYTSKLDRSIKSYTKVVNSHSIVDLPRPSRVSIDVNSCFIYLLRQITDTRGSLSVGEVPTELPFTPARFFTVYDVPSVELRGEHAHKQCEQFLICLHGSCNVLLDDGRNRCEVVLDRPDLGIYMPAMIWGTQYRYSSDAVLMVFASHAYDPNDYIRTYDEFIKSKHLG